MINFSKSVVGVISFCVLSLPSTSMGQDYTPPLIADIDGLNYEGKIAGLDTWSSPSSDFVWVLAPDGVNVMASFIYSGRGVDIGSALTGRSGLPFDALIAMGQENASNALVAPAGDGDPGVDDFVSPIIETDGSTEIVLPESVMQEAEIMIEGLSEEDRRTVLISLVERLRPVTSEAEFAEAIRSWREDVAGVTARGADTPQDGDVTLDPVSVIDVDPSPATGADPVSFEAGDATADQILADMRENAMWFGLGDASAPVVYAFMDPQCPYCAASVEELRPLVERGEIQLRIALAPLISESSPMAIAGIFLDPNPQTAFFDHERARTEGRRSPLEMAPFEILPEELRSGVRANYDMILKYKISGVPYFVYETEDGAVSYSGQARADQFRDAIPDSFQGN